jgi:hypothetical protein
MDAGWERGLFHQPWWLDAVAGPGNWGEVVVREGGKDIASLPWVARRRFGLTLLTMPPLTQTLGPWFTRLPGKPATVLGREKDLVQELVAGLPAHAYFHQAFPSTITNWLPWYWLGFRQTTAYTYVLDALEDEEKLWDGLLPKVRTDLQKARDRLNVRIRNDLPLDSFMALNRLVFERQGLRCPYPDETVRRLDAACEQRGCRRIFFAEDSSGNLHAAVYVAWDQERAYYLMGGSDPRFRNSGATSLALWEAIRFARGVVPTFDFEGSMIEPVERFIRGFGARQVPYHRVWRAPNRCLALSIHARNAWRDLIRPH